MALEPSHDWHEEEVEKHRECERHGKILSLVKKPQEGQHEQSCE
jgi:hypothetical protein